MSESIVRKPSWRFLERHISCFLRCLVQFLDHNAVLIILFRSNCHLSVIAVRRLHRDNLSGHGCSAHDRISISHTHLTSRLWCCESASCIRIFQPEVCTKAPAEEIESQIASTTDESIVDQARTPLTVSGNQTQLREAVTRDASSIIRFASDANKTRAKLLQAVRRVTLVSCSGVALVSSMCELVLYLAPHITNPSGLSPVVSMFASQSRG